MTAACMGANTHRSRAANRKSRKERQKGGQKRSPGLGVSFRWVPAHHTARSEATGPTTIRRPILAEAEDSQLAHSFGVTGCPVNFFSLAPSIKPNFHLVFFPPSPPSSTCSSRRLLPFSYPFSLFFSFLLQVFSPVQLSLPPLLPPYANGFLVLSPQRTHHRRLRR